STSPPNATRSPLVHSLASRSCAPTSTSRCSVQSVARLSAPGSSGALIDMRTRKPAQLLLALFGELVVDRIDEPVPATLIIDVLDGADIAAPTTRATLGRMANREILEPVRRGREIG